MRYLIEAWLSDNEDQPSFLTEAGEPVLVDEKDLEEHARGIRSGRGFIGDWADMQKLGDWRVAKILAHPVGEPRDVTHPLVPVPRTVNGNEVLVDSMFRAADGTTYYACRWYDAPPSVDEEKSFLLIFDTVTVKFAGGEVVDGVEWVGDK